MNTARDKGSVFLHPPAGSWRLLLVLTVLGLAFLAIARELVQLHRVEQPFLAAEGDKRSVRNLPVFAPRGAILDRNGEPLAVSAPAWTVSVNPALFQADSEALTALEAALGAGHAPGWLLERINDANRRFAYLDRQVSPEQADVVRELREKGKVSGIYLDYDPKRFYPGGEVAAHVVGFANIDQQGQEGVELAFDHWLAGKPGQRRVLINAHREVIRHMGLIKEANPGRDLQLSLDLRLQFHAYRELKAAVTAHRAEAASLAMIDVQTGQVLALASQPGFNPNDRSSLQPAAVRNRAVVDVFEPGSVVKPFTLAAALMQGTVNDETRVDTSPGFLRLNGRTIRDLQNLGAVSVSEVLQKSSNVGTAQIALKTGGDTVYQQFFDMGLGQPTGIELPGEGVGSLPAPATWRPLTLATFSYGYGLAVTTVQLAQAYATIASGGIRYVPTLLAQPGSRQSQRVLSEEVAATLTHMLEQATHKGGTGTRATTRGYRVAGKTGTAHLAASGGYESDRYLAVFAGFAPVSHPRLALVVCVSAPNSGEYYGGEVAAPIFSRVMETSLRILNVAPDQQDDGQLAEQSKRGPAHG